MPQNIVKRSKIAESLAVVAVFVALATSLTMYFVNQRAINRVNESRKELTLRSCRESNQRNINTIKTLDTILAKSKASDEQKKSSRALTILLINSLAPHRDCGAYVADRIH